SKDLYKSKVFDQVRMDIRTYVNNSKVDSILFNIRGRLYERARLGQPNDAVMFYFLGQETVNADDRLLWTSETQLGPQGPENVLPLGEIVNHHFRGFPGAQVLFFDLGSNLSQAKGLAQEQEYRLALFRYVQPKEPTQKLMRELAREMPQATWLDQLRDNLRSRFTTDSFFDSLPRNLKMKINSDSHGQTK